MEKKKIRIDQNIVKKALMSLLIALGLFIVFDDFGKFISNYSTEKQPYKVSIEKKTYTTLFSGTIGYYIKILH